MTVWKTTWHCRGWEYSDNDQFYRSSEYMYNNREIVHNLQPTCFPWVACSRLSDSVPDYLGDWNRLLPGVWARRQSARRVCWQAKFFFVFWPPILMIQDANSHTHPTPHRPPRFRTSDVLRWFFVIRDYRKSYDFESGNSKRRNLRLCLLLPET